MIYHPCYYPQINEDKSKIRRNPDKPLPENNQDRVADLKKRSLYVVSWQGVSHTKSEKNE